MINDSDVKFPIELDTTFNFKLNSVLKSEFELLCKSNHSNMSRELKVYMEKCVKRNSLNIIRDY